MEETIEVKEEVQVPKESKRDTYLKRMRERMPDTDFDNDDPEVRYGAFSEYDDQVQKELGAYKDSDGKLKELFKKDPRFATFLSDVVGGGDPASGFVRQFGRDVLDMEDDEEKAKLIAEANQEYLARVADSENLRAEQEKNMEETSSVLAAFKEEKGMDDEKFEKFINQIYGIVEGALKGTIGSDFLEMMFKGLNYDTDVQSAAAAGEIEGRNQQIEEKMQKMGGDEIPNLAGGSNGGTKREPRVSKRNFYD